jgi:hypothetical protein
MAVRAICGRLTTAQLEDMRRSGQRACLIIEEHRMGPQGRGSRGALRTAGRRRGPSGPGKAGHWPVASTAGGYGRRTPKVTIAGVVREQPAPRIMELHQWTKASCPARSIVIATIPGCCGRGGCHRSVRPHRPHEGMSGARSPIG